LQAETSYQVAAEWRDKCWKAEEDNRLLRKFIDDLPCDCLDEYGNPFPQVCDRCKVLGRVLDEAAEANSSGAGGG